MKPWIRGLLDREIRSCNGRIKKDKRAFAKSRPKKSSLKFFKFNRPDPKALFRKNSAVIAKKRRKGNIIAHITPRK